MVKMGVKIFVFLGEHPMPHLKDCAIYGQSLNFQDKPKRVSLLVGKAQLAEYLKLWLGDPMEWNTAIK